jgi:hypothetical protein
MAEMFMEKMHAFGNLLQDEWQVFTTPETHLPKIRAWPFFAILILIILVYLEKRFP